MKNVKKILYCACVTLVALVCLCSPAFANSDVSEFNYADLEYSAPNLLSSNSLPSFTVYGSVTSSNQYFNLLFNLAYPDTNLFDLYQADYMFFRSGDYEYVLMKYVPWDTYYEGTAYGVGEMEYFVLEVAHGYSTQKFENFSRTVYENVNIQSINNPSHFTVVGTIDFCIQEGALLDFHSNMSILREKYTLLCLFALLIVFLFFVFKPSINPISKGLKGVDL